MTVTCEKCRVVYDDLYRLTICPHKKFEMHCRVVFPDGSEKCCHSIEEVNQILEARKPTIAEIVKGLLHADCVGGASHPWTSHDYEKGWLVIQLMKERAMLHWSNDCEDFNVLPTDYAKLERRVREWEKSL